MLRKARFAQAVIPILLIAAMLLSACGATATPTAVPTVAPTAVKTTAPTAAPATATSVPPTATKVVPTNTPAPAVGGTFVWMISYDPATLDAQKASTAAEVYVTGMLGSSLVTRSPADGSYIGYLAESWKFSTDGLQWDFVLKKGVKFHDGTPFTAKDYVYTFNRALDPATASTGAASLLGPVEKVEALDDYTLRLTLKEPFFPLLYNLCSPEYLQPLSQAAIEKLGDKYGLNPVGVGPYVFKEFRKGEKVVVERNPDFNWGPAYAHKGPWYIQTIEYRVLPEYATASAGLETGEIHYMTLDVKDVERFKAGGKVEILTVMRNGTNPHVAFNLTKAPFTDVKVRKAFNLAVDKESLIKVMMLGNAIPQYGPLSPPMAGYWAGIDKYGYKFDLAQAKALMKEAGYTEGADGMLSKDGTPLKVELKVYAIERFVKLAQLMQDQYKALGVAINVQQVETGNMVTDLRSGNYQTAVGGMDMGEADLLYWLFHSSQIGAFNFAQCKDPALDKLLEATRTTMDPTKRQEAVNQAEQYIVENALMCTLYIPMTYSAVSKAVKGAVISKATGGLYLDDAYFTTK